MDDLIAALGLFARLILGLTLLVAGSAKLVDGTALRRFVREVLRCERAALATSAVAVGEIVLGGLILLGLATRPVTLVALVFLLVFTSVIVKAVKSKISVPCGCFGRLDHEPVGARTVLRNVSLISLALLVALLPAKYSVMSVDAVVGGVRAPSIGDVLPLLLTECALAAAAVVAWAGIQLHRRSLQPPPPRDLGDLSRAWYGEDRDDLDERFLRLKDTGKVDDGR